MKVLDNIARWLFILCLPALLLTASIGWAVNSLWLYENGFEKYNVGQVTGLADTELEKAAAGLIDYFNSDEEYISLTVIKDGKPFELFNEREIVHLKDVKALFWLDYRLLLGTLIYVLAYAGLFLFWRKDRRRLARGVLIGSSITLGILAAFGVMSTFVDFSQAFTQFHFIAFTNQMWMLDPATDYLLMLVPEGFWFDTTLLIGGITAGLAVILGGVSGIYLKRRRQIS